MLSIITITHNRKAFLEKAIASVLSQNVADLEHIIVDDGSTDGTSELIAGMNDPRVKYISLPHSGHLSRLRNAGLERAGCGLVAFLDSDDFFEPDYLQKLIEIYKDPGIKTVICNAYVLSAGLKSAVFKREFFPGDNLLRLRLKNRLIVYSSCLSFRRLPGAPDRFNERMLYGDSDLCIRRLTGGGVHIINDPLVTIAKHSTNNSQSSRENPSFIPAYSEALETLENLKAAAQVSSLLYARTASFYLYQLAHELRTIGRRREAKQNYRKAFLKFPLNLKALARLLNT